MAIYKNTGLFADYFLTEKLPQEKRWLDASANKTLLNEYHRHSFDQVLAVLERNKNKLKAFNPKSRAAQENLEKEFQASVAKLTPLKAKIRATDDLIDQIVYKLYGLTDEEIAIVEGNDERNGK